MLPDRAGKTNKMGNVAIIGQTWNLSKILYPRIFRLKILHHQFHLILTVLVGKTQKMRENEEIYTAGKSFTLDRMVIFAKKFVKVHFLLGNDFSVWREW